MIRIVGSENTFTDIRMAGGCPRCGGDLLVISGTLTTTADGIEIISGPQWTWDVVESLRLGLKRIVENPPEDPVAAVEVVNPEVGAIVRKATVGWTRDQKLALIAAIFAVLSWSGVAPADIAGWLRTVGHHVIDTIRDASENGPPPSKP